MTSWTRRQAVYACGLLLGGLTCGLAQAQTTPRPTIRHPADVLTVPQERIALGTELVFTPKATPTATALLRAGLQVRVFRLDEHGDRPRALTTLGDCEVHLASVYPLHPVQNGLQFVRLGEGWINLSNSLGSTKDARWLLVFEQVGPHEEQFRIKTGDAAAYFATGVVITVFDNDSIPLKRLQDDFLARRSRAIELYQQVDAKSPGIPCYGYRALSAQTEPDQPTSGGEVLACRMDDARVSPG